MKESDTNQQHLYNSLIHLEMSQGHAIRIRLTTLG